MTDKAIEPPATTRFGKRLIRHPVVSMIIGSSIVGVILWSSASYFGVLLNDRTQTAEINNNKDDVKELKIDVKEIQKEQIKQGTVLTEIKTIVENLN